MKDYYKILEISPSADADTIKNAYRRLAKVHHPDVNPGDSAAEAKFKEIAEAYTMLSDSEKRAEYNRSRSSAPKQKAGGKRTAPIGAVDFEEMMRDFSRSFSDDSINEEAADTKKQKDPFKSDELFEKFMGFK